MLIHASYREAWKIKKYKTLGKGVDTWKNNKMYHIELEKMYGLVVIYGLK